MPITGLTKLRIGATEAGLLELYNRGIEAPDDWTYSPYSLMRTDGTGAQRGYGYPVASWTWAVLAQMSLNKLLGFFDADTDASVSVYITTYTDTGNKQSTSDFSAYMQRPIDGEGKSLFPGSGGRVMQNVTINFTHLEAA